MFFITGCGATYETRYKPIINEPNYTINQVLAICRPQAEAEGWSAKRLAKSQNKDTGGGFWGGAASSVSANGAYYRAYNQVMSGCLASNGYSAYSECVSGC